MAENNEVNNQVHKGVELIKINADNNSKQFICFHWLSFFTITLVIYLSTLSLPDTIFERETMICQKSSTYLFNEQLFIMNLIQSCSVQQGQQQKRALYVTDWQPQEQFFLAQAQFDILPQGTEISSVFQFSYSLTIYQVELKYPQLVALGQLYENDNKNHTVEISCSRGLDEEFLTCNPFTISYFTKIDQPQIVILLEVLQRGNIKIENIQLKGYSVSRSFTNSLIAMRYTFLFISALSFLLYDRRLKKLGSTHQVVEQKLIHGLSALVFFFNDPFYALTVIEKNDITPYLGVIFMANFVVFLLYFWVFCIQRINNENGQKDTQLFRWSTTLLFVLLWFTIVISYSILEKALNSDPTVVYESHRGEAFIAFYVIEFILVSLILVYICIQYIIFCRDYDKLIWRYKVFGVFSLYFILVYALIMFTGSFQIRSFEGNRVLLTVSMMNLYIYYMQYMWSPTAQGIKEQDFDQQVELQSQVNAVYDQLDDDGIKISFQGKQQYNEVEDIYVEPQQDQELK